ncbi:MAG: hypothetical protein FJX74_21190, partial [Armatimonadetes bacterium]|nr:hypothetical protein [Armatimonadota bacterium]
MVRETRLERAEMSGPLRFTDLGMLIGDHAFRRVACNVLDALAADTPAELERLADAEVREARFDAFWNRWVEPDGE